MKYLYFRQLRTAFIFNGTGYLLALASLFLCKRYDYLEGRDAVPYCFGAISLFAMIGLQISLATDSSWILALPVGRKSFLQWNALRQVTGLTTWGAFFGAAYFSSRIIFYIPPDNNPETKITAFSYPVWLYFIYFAFLAVGSAISFWPKRTFKMSTTAAIATPLVGAALAIALINEWITFFWATMFCGILICFGFGRSVCENFALKKSRWKTPILVACCVHVAVSMLALTGYWLNSKSADMGAKLAAYEEIGPLLPKLESNLLPDLIAYDGAHYRSGALKIFSRYSDEPLDKAVLRSDIKLVFERFERRYGGGISKSCMPSGNIDDWQLWKNEGFVPELLSHLHRCESNDVVVPYAGMLFLNFDSATLKRLKELSGQLEKSFFLQYAKINPEIMSPRETLEWAKNNQIGLDNRKRALELYYVQTGNSITLDSIVRSPASIAPSKFSVIDCKSPWTPKTSPDEKIRAKFEQEEKFRITKCLSSELRSYAYDTSLFLFQSRTRGTGNFPIVSLRYASPYDTDARIGKLCKANSTSLYCVHNK